MVRIRCSVCLITGYYLYTHIYKNFHYHCHSISLADTPDRTSSSKQWRIQRGAVGAAVPPIGAGFFLSQKAAFFRVKAYSPLRAFTINDDGNDKWSSAPPPPLQNLWIRHW